MRHSPENHLFVSHLFAIRWLKRLALVTLLAAVALPMAGCGKKGPLDPPPGSEDSQYPRAYPTY